MQKNQIKTKDIETIDKNKCFLHYTNQNNINSIFRHGLEPRIGKNSIAIEKSKKIFFTIGFDNTLILMDAWIKWLVLRPKSNLLYRCGAFFMTKSYFPKIIVDTLWKKWIKNEKRINRACTKLNKILNESVFLLLELKENIDYLEKDIDEVKNQTFSRQQLKYIYTYHYDVNDTKMENWNMHTITDKKIEKEKITLLKYNDTKKANDLIKYMVNSSNIDFEKELPFFNRYINTYIKVEKL